MENINIEKLVSDIKTAEEARRGTGWDIKTAEEARRGTGWDIWCSKRGLGTTHTKEGSFRGAGGTAGRFYPDDYAEHMTSLYTLRAFLRGRMHRKNPPEEIRDYNRSMQENGSEHRLSWDMEEHNRKIAEGASNRYQREEAA